MTVDDHNGGTDAQTVSVTINGNNDAPVFISAANFSVPENNVTIGAIAAIDPESDLFLFALAGGSDQAFFSIDAHSGHLTLKGSLDFETPEDANHDNVYDLVVSATDTAGASTTQTIHGNVTDLVEPGQTINGDNGSNSIVGGPGNDKIAAGNGDDYVNGGDGDDTLSGGNGNDILIGGRGNDVLDGANGDDALEGGGGNNQLSGGNGSDTLRAGDGNNQIDGGNGNDVIVAGNGNNVLSGGEGNDVITAGNGNNVLPAAMAMTAWPSAPGTTLSREETATTRLSLGPASAKTSSPIFSTAIALSSMPVSWTSRMSRRQCTRLVLIQSSASEQGTRSLWST